MKVFVLHYHAEFDLEEYENIYCYDTFDKAHTNFIDIIRGWEDKELFNTKIFGEDGEICVNNWDSDEVYNGFYAKYSKAENFFLEERDNVCNFIHIYIEECDVM